MVVARRATVARQAVVARQAEKIRKLENEKMGSDKKDFLTGLTCRTNQTGQDFRKKTEEIIKRLGGFLMKKGCKEGGVSL